MEITNNQNIDKKGTKLDFKILNIQLVEEKDL